MKLNNPKITLFRGTNNGVYAGSPFAAKLETRLRFSNQPYSAQPGVKSQSPKGKIPYVRIEDEESGVDTIMSDSTLITAALIESGLIEDLNASLSPSQKTVDLALRSLLEDKLYFMTARFPFCSSIKNYFGPSGRILVPWLTICKFTGL